MGWVRTNREQRIDASRDSGGRAGTAKRPITKQYPSDDRSCGKAFPAAPTELLAARVVAARCCWWLYLGEQIQEYLEMGRNLLAISRTRSNRLCWAPASVEERGSAAAGLFCAGKWRYLSGDRLSCARKEFWPRIVPR